MSPRGPSRAPKYRKPGFAKTLKNHLFFKVFGGPRPSKTASEDPRRLPRGYLGFLGAILSHLGAILETRAFKIAPARFARAPAPPSWAILVCISGPKIGSFLVILGVILLDQFLNMFRITFGAILGPTLGPDRPKRGQDRPKRAI